MAGFPAIRITAITMAEADGHAQLKLRAWLSPAFPVGGFCYSHGLERVVHDDLADIAALAEALTAFLHAFLSNLLQAGIRLGVLGQVEAARAAHSTLADLGGGAFIAETMAMRHETQQSRLFRS